ncbi:hypothetical protein VMT65_06520 [Nocardia sp. CDC153]|uniref:hypothetical protein n=1 Tax=Nocardia sp. CDC153 TaxID=3112167 RepID=UPI002DB8E89D|nr:hypothetical protein [Nocardia sp. CDC153]MEC3952679.1 hypothetical protein [Nocardia sp. CDC153]
MTTVVIRRYPDGLYGIVPDDNPGALEAAAGPDVMVLEVFGGHLVWNALAAQELPAALIDDIDLAQEWVWALFGEPVALALDDIGAGGSAGDAVAATAAPASPDLAVSARRLAYAHWASRWWPASTLDGIAALDQVLLDRDIAVLTEECESLVDGADALAPLSPTYIESPPLASDYALAAGDESRTGTMVLARGTGGWDWRRCPPGLVDASESAVSWQLIRAAGETTVAISVAAHPDLPPDLPSHLRPHARIDTGRGELDAALRPADDTWLGESAVTAPTSAVRVAIHVPGFGPLPESADLLADGADSAAAAAALRDRIREFAASRLRLAATPAADDRDPFAPLLAEIAAAAGDSDF